MGNAVSAIQFINMIEALGFKMPVNCLRAKIILEPEEAAILECEVLLSTTTLGPDGDLPRAMKRYRLIEEDVDDQP